MSSRCTGLPVVLCLCDARLGVPNGAQHTGLRVECRLWDDSYHHDHGCRHLRRIGPLPLATGISSRSLRRPGPVCPGRDWKERCHGASRFSRYPGTGLGGALGSDCGMCTCRAAARVQRRACACPGTVSHSAIVGPGSRCRGRAPLDATSRTCRRLCRAGAAMADVRCGAQAPGREFREGHRRQQSYSGLVGASAISPLDGGRPPERIPGCKCTRRRFRRRPPVDYPARLIRCFAGRIAGGRDGHRDRPHRLPRRLDPPS